MHRSLPAAFLFLLVILLHASLLSAAPDAANLSQKGDIQVTGINPTGLDVPAGREIVINFNRPVVSLGRMERSSGELPVTIDPPLPCDWRWVNSSSLSCQLSEKNALSPSTTYTRSE